ncbi:MAG: hypothetical protein ACHQDC_08045 [Acidimicrobiales bacterium]
MPDTVVLLDADTVAGWRRTEPSLEQLHRAVSDLTAQHPDVTVAVLADPSIKWALPEAEQPAFEDDIVSRSVVCAPAGTKAGVRGWIEAVAAAVRSDGAEPLIVTDQVIEGVPVVRLSSVEGHFRFDLEGAAPLVGRTASQHHRPRRTKRS